MLDKIKNYRLYHKTLVILYGCVVFTTFLFISIAYKNLNLIKD